MTVTQRKLSTRTRLGVPIALLVVVHLALLGQFRMHLLATLLVMMMMMMALALFPTLHNAIRHITIRTKAPIAN